MTMLSPGDTCRPFGQQADGIVDSEGVGAVVLKPLAQAEADGDHIYGVIKGSMLNAGGKTSGYTGAQSPIASAVNLSGIGKNQAGRAHHQLYRASWNREHPWVIPLKSKA